MFGNICGLGNYYRATPQIHGWWALVKPVGRSVGIDGLNSLFIKVSDNLLRCKSLFAVLYNAENHGYNAAVNLSFRLIILYSRR